MCTTEQVWLTLSLNKHAILITFLDWLVVQLKLYIILNINCFLLQTQYSFAMAYSIGNMCFFPSITLYKCVTRRLFHLENASCSLKRSTMLPIKHLGNAKEDSLVKLCSVAEIFLCYWALSQFSTLSAAFLPLFLSMARQETFKYWGHDVTWNILFLYFKIMLTSPHCACSLISMWI